MRRNWRISTCPISLSVELEPKWHGNKVLSLWHRSSSSSENETPNVEEKLEALMKAFAASPARDALEESYFGTGYFEKYDDYEVYTNPEYLRLSQEEAALLSEYRELTSELLVSYDGETMTLDEWLETDDYSEYIGALQAYYEQYNPSVGEVFVKLVKVRQQLAAALGYDSYAEYSYEMDYKRV